MNDTAIQAEEAQNAQEAAVREPAPDETQRKRGSKRKKGVGKRNNNAEPMFGARRKKRHGVLRVIGVILGIIFIVVSSAAAFVLTSGIADNRNFEISYYQAPSVHLNQSIRIVLLSDLHNHEFGEKNCELLDKIERCQPDLICIVGDMMNNYEADYHVIIDLLNNLQARQIAPVYYSYGNHEMDVIHAGGDQLDKDIKATGVTVLRNSFESIEVAGNTVSIAGLTTRVQDYETYGASDMMREFQQAPGFRLLLAHYPHYFTEIFHGENAIDVELALCGHAHGGIIRIPKIGGLYASGQSVFPELTEGEALYGNCTVVVSRGLGGRKFPVRLNNRPELVVIDVSRTAAQSDG